ncbi:hypothetical protein L9F63_008020, partial [Diploptera punctata]
MAALKMTTYEQLTAEEFRQSELWMKMNTTVFETAVSWKHESYERFIDPSIEGRRKPPRNDITPVDER